MAQNQKTTKIIIDKRKLDTLLRLNCDKELLYEYITTGSYTKTEDSLINDYLETLLIVKEFNNWGGKRENTGRKKINQVENQLENQDENQVGVHLGDIDRDIDIDIDIDIDNNSIDINTNTISNNKEEKIKKTETETEKPKQVLEAYHQICTNLPKVIKISSSREKHIKARLKNYSIADFKLIFLKANNSKFLCGENDRNWKANFDWLINENNMIKVLEGKYDNKIQVKKVYEYNPYA